MIESSVAFLKQNSEQVFYDAEHFFDGYKANKTHAVDTLHAAVRGGADFLVLCDTNGGTMPWEVEAITLEMASLFDTPLGVHAHDDSGLGVANSIYAVKSGATMVQGVFNGYGERCGNANLTTILANLHFKTKHTFFADSNVAKLRKMSMSIDEIVNLPSNVRAPYVGDAAFAHKGRSEEHTSELQSRPHLVCRLLLEK